jgi:predicted RNA-binding protein with TRAM domain
MIIHITNLFSIYIGNDQPTFLNLQMNYEQRRTGSLDRDFDPKPVEIGKEYDVQVTEISRKGDGIARIQGFVIFVMNGQVGQNVKVKITQIGSTFATAEIV